MCDGVHEYGCMCDGVHVWCAHVMVYTCDGVHV